MFEIGQDVVCIAKPQEWDWLDDGKPSLPIPRFKGVYTIIAIEFWERNRRPNSYLKFAQIAKGAYDARAFRPVRKTDISIFEQSLIRPRVDA